MTIKLESSKEKYTPISTTIGDLVIFYIRVGDQRRLQEFFEKEPEDSDPEESIRELIKCIGFPAKDLNAENQRPDSMLLTDDDVKRLTADDLEKISKHFIDNNKDLYTEQSTESSVNEDGVTELKTKNGEVIYPKKESDSWTEYLYKLIYSEFKELNERFQSTFASTMGIRRFSKDIESSISRSLSLGDSLSKKLAGIQNPMGDSFKAVRRATDAVSLPSDRSLDAIRRATTTSIPKLNVPSVIQQERSISEELIKHERRKEENRVRPFNELGEKLDRIIDLNVTSANFSVEMNKTQLAVAEEIKKSSDVSSEQSKKNISLTKVVIGLTIVGLLIPVATSFFNYKMAAEEQEGLQEAYTALNENIGNLTRSIDSSFDNSTETQERLNLLIEDQKAEIDRLTEQYNEQIETIRELEAEIQEIQKNGE